MSIQPMDNTQAYVTWDHIMRLAGCLICLRDIDFVIAQLDHVIDYPEHLQQDHETNLFRYMRQFYVNRRRDLVQGGNDGD